MKVRNTFIIFIVSGFWHGANWTFIVWGALNAIYFLPLLLARRNRVNLGPIAMNSLFPSMKEVIGMLITFGLTVLAWVFFRAENIDHAISFIAAMFTQDLFIEPKILPWDLIVLIMLFMVVEWFGRERQYALEGIANIKSSLARFSLNFLLVICIILFMSNTEEEFIYFQF